MKPTKVRKVGDKELHIFWDDGHESSYPIPYLRDHCPCALCREYRKAAPQSSPGLRILTDAEEKKYDMASMRTVGNYAICFVWKDAHETGIYPFEYLRKLCQCAQCRSASQQNGKEKS